VAGARILGPTVAVGVQAAGAATDLQNGEPADTVAVERGSRVAGTLGGALVGAEAGAAVGSVVPGPGTAIGAVVGGVAGGLAGDSAGQVVGDVYREVRAGIRARVDEAGQVFARGFDDWIGRSGYRPYGTRN